MPRTPIWSPDGKLLLGPRDTHRQRHSTDSSLDWWLIPISGGDAARLSGAYQILWSRPITCLAHRSAPALPVPEMLVRGRRHSDLLKLHGQRE